MTTATTVQVKLKLRGDTAANWTSVNPVLLANELGRETDTGKIKIGDGTTAWTSLAYQPFGAQITNADISATAEIAVSKLADGTARQLLQTDAAGTGVEWASNIDIPGTLDVTGAATFDEHVNIASTKEYRIAGTKVLDATSLGSAVVSSSLTSVGTIGTGVWQGTTVATGYGGTAQTSYTDGQLLIGKTDGTLAKATLTAGTGITIANGDGSITLTAAGATGTILENQQTISADYTLTTGYNGVSAGPIEVAAGFSVTVPAGATWAII